MAYVDRDDIHLKCIIRILSNGKRSAMKILYSSEKTSAKTNLDTYYFIVERFEAESVSEGCPSGEWGSAASIVYGRPTSKVDVRSAIPEVGGRATDVIWNRRDVADRLTFDDSDPEPVAK